MSSLFSSQDLIDAGRQLEVPFKVSLLLNGKTETAECTQLLRLVPGRRVVVELLIGNTTYLGKIFVGTERTKYCQREQSGIQALQNAGILTAKLEGQGCLADHGAEVLLLEFLLQVQHLSELLASQQPDALRQLETAVSVMATLHDSGLLHKDCHLDNFLVNEQGLYLIDGDAVEQTTALTQAGALENLALFFVQLPLLLNHRLAELFAHYCERRGWSQGNTQPAFRQQIQKQRANRQRRFLKKVFRDCTQFKVTKNWSRFVALDRQTDSPELQALIGNPDRYIEAGQLLKDGNSATVAKVKLGDKAYVVKRYNLKSLVHWMARFWRPSRAWASWRNAQLLCFYGIGTPKPVAMLEQRCGALRGKAYFITEHLAADNASKYVEKLKDEPQVLENLAEQFADLFDAMKLLRLSHGDFKATNFLLDKGALSVIDLDSMALHSTLQSHQKAFAKDQQRFMKNWLSDARVEAVMAKALQRHNS